MTLMSDISISLESVLAEIERARQLAPKAQPVKLIAVSKQQPDEKLEAALAANMRVFGENRVQEASTHWAHRRAVVPDLELHLIGPLQTNKAAEAVALFDVIHTVDRPKLARILAQEMQKQGRNLSCFIQVNTGMEPQKSGVLPDDTANFIQQCQTEFGLDIIGLMCIPPADEEPVMHFALLKKLGDAAGLSQLSMGMSGDYPAAIQLGATHIRVGSSLFGARLPRS